MSKTKTKNVCCVNCFNEPEIKAFIGDLNLIGNCKYCKTGKVKIADVSDVAEFIRAGVERMYSTPEEEGVGWDHEEDRYHLDSEITDIEDILGDWDIFSSTLTDPTKLLTDLGFVGDDTDYIRKDPYGPELGAQEDLYRWEEFCNHVKHDRRFTVPFKPPDKRKRDEDHPGSFIDNVARRVIREMNYFIPRNTLIYRARRIKDNEAFDHKDLTSPPLRSAINNRMSPAGISLFYGGMSSDTVIAEVRPFVGERVAVGRFRVLEDLRVLDLSKQLPRTSPLSESYSFFFEEFTRPFLQQFTQEIGKPILPDDAAIDYVPTQIFTEYVRFFEGSKEEPIAGMIYKSSMHTRGKCLVLFRGPDISLPEPERPKPWLLYMGTSVYQTAGVNYKIKKEVESK